MKEFKQDVQLSIRGLKKSYGDAEILKGVNLDVRQGEVVVILGPSGSGKSTFLRCINGLEEIQGGEVRLDGETISGLKNSALPAVRQKLGMVFQSYDLFPHMNILDNITLAPTKVQKRSRKEAEAEARELLSRVNLADKEKAYPRMLSGGQKQRVAIVRALAMHPELMLFDEVTAALDPEMVREVLDVIMELSEQGLTMLIVTHEMSFARAVADRIVFMDGGHIVETGTPEEFFTAPKTERARTFLNNFQFIAKSRKEEKSA
ncbi:amino acid ABC transporter ATP-binding protein [Stomatobaculum longum]|jgi:glutamate transport ATP-binding protein|uniref:amino acid ABC transporter ATP-binding protein n=1 Tax=Stomatobaculum longum TaxID=796942 RepID=UPI0028063A48|nr:amino acid ABC transporter ATP-binding protein [Stomatobaculum longum]